MPDPLNSSRSGGRAVMAAVFCALLLFGPAPVTAHDMFASYVQQKIRVTAGARHLDVIVDLTFFEEWSARERARMDADGDERITRAERESYLKNRASQLTQQVRLRIADRELDLMPLYEPELDLLGSDKTGPGHHRLRLWFFAATPAELQPGAEIVLENRLWPEAGALGTIEAQGRDGFVLEAINPRDPLFPPARPGEARIFKVRCLEAPLARPE